MDKND